MSDEYPIPEVWINPQRRGGQPCIAGTRIPVSTIAGLARRDVEPKDIKRWYPGITADTAQKVTRWYDERYRPM